MALKVKPKEKYLVKIARISMKSKLYLLLETTNQTITIQGRKFRK